jgi:beta-fructofuranosidase
MWAWLLNLPIAPTGVQSLPRELSLPDDGVLQIMPLRELESLRHDEKSETNLAVKAGSPTNLKGIAGDALELKLSIEPGMAKEFGLDVLCDANGQNGLRIAYVAESKTLRVGNVHSPFVLQKGECLNLRVYLDKNLVEVFANDRQAALAAQNYAAGNTAIQLFSKGGDVVVKEVKSWKMKSIWHPDTK